MGKSIFVSYKYSDSQVQTLPGIKGTTTARDYVDVLETLLERGDHIYKGEDDGEDMSSLADATIGSKLGDKIFYSSVTIVLISKGMKENKPEKDQWIPWEISYSLKEQSRESGNSKTNAVLAVVLPDEIGSYRYYIEDENCPHCHSRLLKTNILFDILSSNMFNIKKPVFSDCPNHVGNKSYTGYSSFINSVKWEDFKGRISKCLDIAIDIRSNIEQYEITKSLK